MRPNLRDCDMLPSFQPLLYPVGYTGCTRARKGRYAYGQHGRNTVNQMSVSEESNKVLGELGLNLSGTVTIFLKTGLREQGLPIDMRIGNHGSKEDQA